MIQPRNLVHLLRGSSPETLKHLRSDFPSAAALFEETAHDLDGSSTTVAAGEVRESETELQAMVGLARASIPSLRERSDAILAELSRRIRQSSLLRTISACVSAFSSAGLIATTSKIFSLSAPSVDLILAVVAFLSTLLTIFADRTAGGAGGQVRELFDQTLALSARVLKAELSLRRPGISQDEAEKILLDLDDVTLAVKELEEKMSIQ